jgi:Xaa-Pro aminopeptidase
MAVAEAEIRKPIPFDTKHLDKLLDDAGIDVLVATSKHNIQYLLGGYRFFFFDTMEAAGTTRYLPAIVYQKGKPENAAYVGCSMENFERELGKFWQPTLKLGTTGTKATMSEVVEHIAKLGPVRRIGVESAFLPADCDAVLRRGVANADVVDAVFPHERVSPKKTPEENGFRHH